MFAIKIPNIYSTKNNKYPPRKPEKIKIYFALNLLEKMNDTKASKNKGVIKLPKFSGNASISKFLP
jgi:hypothetical protein